MMRRRNDGLSLPTTSQSSNTPDGSGGAIHMDAPIVRAAKNSSTYTRVSYACLVLSILLIWWGWVDIHHHNAYTHLNCSEGDECLLTIQPPARAKPFTLTIAREQIVDSMSLMVDAEGRPTTPIIGMKHHHHFNNSHKHHTGEEKEHESYAIVLRQNGARDEDEKLEDALEGIVSQEKIHHMEKFGSAAMTDPNLINKVIAKNINAANDKVEKIKLERRDLPKLDALADYADKNQMNEFVLIIRKYNIGHTRRRVPTLVTRINQYASNHRSKINIKEKRQIRWQGILGIVFGMFALLLTLIAGQFSDPPRKFGGPGASQRRSKTTPKVTKSYGGYDHRG